MVRSLVRLVALLAIGASIAMGLSLPTAAATVSKPAAAIQVCKNGICDGRDPAAVPANRQRVLQPVVQWNRKIELIVDDSADPMGWANISNGNANDVVWLDRSFDGGSTWEPQLGITVIPAGQTSWRTLMYWGSDVGRTGLLRACGKAGDRPEVACTAWLPICRAGVCDGADPARATATKQLASTWQWNRRIDLNVTYGVGGGMAWANISNAVPGDQVWIDRSGNGGAGWSGHLGDAYVPGPDWTSWRTWMYSLVSLGQWQIRACGKAGDRPEVSCTGWLPVCNGGLCDGADPTGSAEKAVSAHGWAWYRRITLHVRTDSRMAWAEIGNSQHPGEGLERDEVWIDRTFTDEAGRNGPLGHTSIPAGGKSWRTWMFAFDDPSHGGVGQLRACGKARDTTEVGCTPWVRASDNPPNIYDEAARAVALDYGRISPGKWEPESGMWLSGNAMTTLIDYMIRTGRRDYVGIVQDIKARFPVGYPPLGDTYYDDRAWWALAWVRAYDLTGDASYLTLAESIAADIRNQWDTTVCGGGIRWRGRGEPDEFDKLTITNTLYLKLAASLYRHGRTGSPSWRDEAVKVWNWFLTPNGRLLIGNVPGVVKDGIEGPPGGSCGYTAPVGALKFTYIQGTTAGALAELYRITGDGSYLDWANGVASATTRNAGNEFRDPNSPEVLYYQPEEADEGLRGNGPDASDGTAFKGVFVRYLREVYDVNVAAGRGTDNWRQFMVDQRDALSTKGRTGWAQFGMHWSGPIKLPHYVTFASTMSGLDAFNASAGL